MNAVANFANLTSLNDERLLIEAAQSDPSRFAELYENNFHRVYAFVARRVNDRDEAQDITAEVFHQALRNLGRFQWRGVPFAAWLMRIAANALTDRWERASRGVEVQAEEILEEHAESAADLGPEVSDELLALTDRLIAGWRAELNAASPVPDPEVDLELEPLPRSPDQFSSRPTQPEGIANGHLE